MYPPSIQKLINLFSKFPTIGSRTASRFVFYLLKLPDKEFDKLLDSMVDLKKSIKICSFCFSPFESEKNSKETLCPICRNKSRKRDTLCVVEKEIDLISIEKTKKYKGLYFILGGTINLSRRGDNNNLRTKELEERIKNSNFKEIIIALNPTVEGESTSLYLERVLKAILMPKEKKLPEITRLGRGLPIGGELEYADEETLENAFKGRK